MSGKTFLVMAVILEMMGTMIMKHLLSLGYDIGYLIMIVFISFSYYLLSKSLQSISIGLAYAFWECVGLSGTTVLAWLLFNEAINAQKFFAITIILIGLLLVERGTYYGTDEYNK